MDHSGSYVVTSGPRGCKGGLRGFIEDLQMVIGCQEVAIRGHSILYGVKVVHLDSYKDKWCQNWP